MKQKKFTQNLSLSSSLNDPLVNSSISKLLGQTTSREGINPIKQFVTSHDLSLEETTLFFEHSSDLDEPSMDEMITSFAHKYSTPTYQSLDELLIASSNQSTYQPTTVKKLSAILDGLIDDL